MEFSFIETKAIGLRAKKYRSEHLALRRKLKALKARAHETVASPDGRIPPDCLAALGQSLADLESVERFVDEIENGIASLDSQFAYHERLLGRFSLLLSGLADVRPDFIFQVSASALELNRALTDARPEWFSHEYRGFGASHGADGAGWWDDLERNLRKGAYRITLHDISEYAGSRAAECSNGIVLSELLLWKQSRKLHSVPSVLPQTTFIEARSAASAISDGRDLRHWKPIDGIVGMLHAPKDAQGRASKFQTQFIPTGSFLDWWGSPPDLITLQEELKELSFDAILLFFVCVSWAIQDQTVDVSLDDLIDAIGRGESARRSQEARTLWRTKVWRWLLILDSLAVVGARDGWWFERCDSAGGKRARISSDKLNSKDALIKIIGHRAIYQAGGDENPVPVEVSFVTGPWVRQWHGNREILSDFGNLRTIASIPGGNPSGALARCIGVSLFQHWRENATRAQFEVATKSKNQSLCFPLPTRRELLTQTWRSDCDVMKILNSNDPGRAKKYWEQAIRELIERRLVIVGPSAASVRTGRKDWQNAWLDEPVDLRPTGQNLVDAITINRSAVAARKRGPRKSRSCF